MPYDNKKPSPKVLGTGSAAQTGQSVKKHQAKTKSRIDEMFKKPTKNNYK